MRRYGITTKCFALRRVTRTSPRSSPTLTSKSSVLVARSSPPIWTAWRSFTDDCTPHPRPDRERQQDRRCSRAYGRLPPRRRHHRAHVAVSAHRWRLHVRAPGHRRRPHRLLQGKQPRPRHQRGVRPPIQEEGAMIPDHLIDKAWRAYVWDSNMQAIRNEKAYPYLRGPMPSPPDTRQSMRAALETVAADIWDDGYEGGAGDEHAINGADKRGEEWPP